MTNKLLNYWQAFKEAWPFIFKLWAMLVVTYISIKLFSAEVMDKVVNIDFVAIVLAVIGIVATILKTNTEKKAQQSNVCKHPKS